MQAAAKFCDLRLELISDPDIYEVFFVNFFKKITFFVKFFFQFFESFKRGGISSVGEQRLEITKEGMQVLSQYAPQSISMLNPQAHGTVDHIFYIGSKAAKI